MKCPKCDEGTLMKIQFKPNGKIAYHCNFCDALWFDNERIAVTTGHTLRTFTQGEEDEFEEYDEQDEDHRPIQSVRNI
jgi:hypothetical protein